MMDSFIRTYADDAPELLDYQVHTYESTLRTAITDMANPKYAIKKQDTDTWRRAFVELVELRYFQTEYSVLMLELNGLDRTFKIMLASSFYPFWEGTRTQANLAKLNKAIALLADDVEIWTSDEDARLAAKTGLVPFIQKRASERRRPWFYFGSRISFDLIASETDWSPRIWQLWLGLASIREYIGQETANHALYLAILELLNGHQEELSIDLYGRSYQVKFDELASAKTNQRRQKFGIYDKGQLFTDGMLENYLREPNEAYGVYRRQSRRSNRRNQEIHSRIAARRKRARK